MNRAGAIGIASILFAAWASADEARYFVPTPLAARVQAGLRSGLVIGLENVPGGAVVTVSQAIVALGSSPRFPLRHPERCGDATALQVPADTGLAAEVAGIREASVTALAALRSVAELVTRRVALDEHDDGSQDAVGVLKRGRARCSGRANLAVGLLRVLGIPARPVHGVVVGEAGAGYHRWGEAWLGSLGWVAFDPGGSVGIVDVRHIPLAEPSFLAYLEGIRMVALDERGFLRLPIARDLRWLPDGGVTVRCIAPRGEAGIVAQLLAPDGSRWIRRGDREVVFERMLPGRYRLGWSSAGARHLMNLILEGAQPVRVYLGGEGAARS